MSPAASALLLIEQTRRLHEHQPEDPKPQPLMKPRAGHTCALLRRSAADFAKVSKGTANCCSHCVRLNAEEASWCVASIKSGHRFEALAAVACGTGAPTRLESKLNPGYSSQAANPEPGDEGV